MIVGAWREWAWRNVAEGDLFGAGAAVEGEGSA